MALRADRAAERDALAYKVKKIRAELDTYTAALGEAEQVLADTPEDGPDSRTSAGAGVAANPTVNVQDNT